MASYYYLVSSLPTLTADGDIPFDYKTFLSMCESNVSEAKYDILKNLTLASTEGPLIEEWAVFYRQLMKELSYQRSMRLGKPYSSAFDKEPESAAVVAAAIAAKNPLEAERMLLGYEFEYLDSLQGLHMFDDYVLFGYALKLKLLERVSCFTVDQGKEEFKHLFEQAQQRVLSL
jgi:hypothetical protein